MNDADARPAALALLLCLVACVSSGCELIASFDRDKIPEPQFSVPDAALLPPGPVIEGGLPMPEGGMDAGIDAGGLMDAMVEEEGGV